jgi:hypothetical protein
MGAKCLDISRVNENAFACQDGQGSDITWSTILESKRQRVWYADGVVKPGVLMPTVRVRAVFVVNLQDGRDETGRPAVRHRGELLIQTDSRAARLVARIMGASAPKTAEQYVGQIQAFFAAMAWYLNEHPSRQESLLKE